jgi:SAM-dependent methyltransferase
LHGTPGSFEVVVCQTCGTGRTLPLVGPDELHAFYPDEYTAHEHPQGAVSRTLATLLYRWRYRRALRRPPLGALRRLGPGTLLDVGSGRGDLGTVLGGRGWRVTGVEPSAAACADARRRGLHVECGSLVDVYDRLEAGYDAVVFQHSLEHVTEPIEDLAAARELLVPSGLLLIAVPNFDSWERRRFGSTWFPLDLPRHRTHFSAQGLERLLRRSGLRPLTLSTSTSADALPMTLQYRLLGRRRFNRRVGLYASVATSLALAPVSVALDALGGGGDVLNAVAERPPNGSEANG